MDNSNANDGNYYQQDTLAMGTAELTVGEIPGGASDEPLVIPDITMKLLPRIAVGQPSPDFGAKTLDGKDFKPGDLKGKYVVFEVFTPGMDAKTGDLPALKAAANTFSGDDRFAMVGIEAYGSTEDMKHFTAVNGMNWTATVVEAKPGEQVNLGFRRFPVIWLVGPDGKVIAKDLKGAGISAALTTALGPEGL
jgi:hypothetical protein